MVTGKLWWRQWLS